MANKRISYKVYGTVQGVNFRWTTVKTAKGLGLTGYVQNASDGTVVGEAQGPEDDLKKLVTYLHKGPPAASVDKVEQKDIDIKTGETGFGEH